VVSSGSDLVSGVARPVIGLTTYLEQAKQGVWDVRAAFLPEVYFRAVTDAGGIAVLLPPQPASTDIADRVVDGLDGLIVTGGMDVDPARYGAEPHPETDAPRRDRDAWEDALLTAAIARELPFLGICRGLQLLNVVRGGSLLQHLPEAVGTERYRAGGGVFTVNEAAVDGDSRLGRLLDDQASIDVRSYHHQAVDRVGDGLRVTATSSDGVVQAVELEGVPFGLAVQWHPEEDAAQDARLFSGLVEAARDYRGLRRAQPSAVSA
jgi:putative glutamine amidotransferase